MTGLFLRSAFSSFYALLLLLSSCTNLPSTRFPKADLWNTDQEIFSKNEYTSNSTFLLVEHIEDVELGFRRDIRLNKVTTDPKYSCFRSGGSYIVNFIEIDLRVIDSYQQLAPAYFSTKVSGNKIEKNESVSGYNFISLMNKKQNLRNNRTECFKEIDGIIHHIYTVRYE